jgi:raffinose/stachyose/melibiose transport system substrate-binding protein
MEVIMKKLLASLSIFALVLTACGGTDTADNNGGDNMEEDQMITILQNKPEIDAQLKAFAAEFTAETGIEVTVKSCGGDACELATQLRADFTAGEAPDIFVIDGLSSFEEWQDFILPLDGEKWVSDTDVAFAVEGTTYGFPVAIEGWGMAYNKEILDAAGIDPATLVNYDAYKEAFEKLDSMKDELGIDSAVSMAAGSGMEWVTRDHNINSYLSAGLAYGDLSVTDQAAAGMLDEDRFMEYAMWVDLLFDFADPSVLMTGGYAEQVGAFAEGKAAFVHQGNWIEPFLADAGATFERGYAPHGTLSSDTDGIFVSAPSWYVVNSDSEYQSAAKEFLTYLATSETGHNYMVNEIGAIPAFKSVTLQPSAPLSASILEWSSEGKIYSWNQYYLPSSFRESLGPIYGQLAADEIDLSKFIELMTAEFDTLK